MNESAVTTEELIQKIEQIRIETLQTIREFRERAEQAEKESLRWHRQLNEKDAKIGALESELECIMAQLAAARKALEKVSELAPFGSGRGIAREALANLPEARDERIAKLEKERDEDRRFIEKLAQGMKENADAVLAAGETAVGLKAQLTVAREALGKIATWSVRNPQQLAEVADLALAHLHEAANDPDVQAADRAIGAAFAQHEAERLRDRKS